MAKKKKKIPGIVKRLSIPFGLAGTSIISNITGSALSPLLPTGVVNPLTRIGTSAAQFAGPAGTIVLSGEILRQLKGIK